ncbi:CgeB family protein [Candidatus Formimonas warabiya]|uniref:Glycosyltransferase n=1 Tax=Formimonas warabiya TaxID=1761012 RepID=A0A3G1KSF2_FORW1|nr:glycosyltransferase [Candidatus Formimonas warabiya]ATW25389.1 hypothetical protein DCMF_11955 [Candidatus Formimonas warabiya]
MLKMLTFCVSPLYMNLWRALAGAGHRVTPVDLTSIPGQDHEAHLIKAVDEAKPDLVLTAGHPGSYANFAVLDRICREKGIFHVYWATGDRVFHHACSMKIASSCDLIFTPAAECLEDYRQMKKPAEILIYGCSPEHHHPYSPDPGLTCDIALAADYVHACGADGAESSERYFRQYCLETLLFPLTRHPYNLSVWGNGWEGRIPDRYIRGKISYEKIPRLYSSAKIVLGLEWDHLSETQTTEIPFEALASKAFLLTYRTKAISNLFIDRTHLALSHSADETVQVVDYYLKHEEARNQVAAEGQREVCGKHNYGQRAGMLIDKVKEYI